jgi:hypothetical protein
MSLYGTEWRERGYGLRREPGWVMLCIQYYTLLYSKNRYIIKEEYLRVNGPGSGTEARGKEEDVEAEGDYNQRTIICKQNKKLNLFIATRLDICKLLLREAYGIGNNIFCSHHSLHSNLFFDQYCYTRKDR